MLVVVKSVTFTSEMISEGSWGHRELGKHESTMELFLNEDDSGMIEWDIPTLEETAHIGLWFGIDSSGKRKLKDYDGLCSLPTQAVQLLRDYGIEVDKEFEA